MQHPLIKKDDLNAKNARKGLAELLKSKYDLVRQGSIVFVCGGNEPNHARTKFIAIATTALSDYDFFTPESALKHPWQSAEVPFNLSHFEELIAKISLAVVVFPEAPGSFCETGYFAAKEEITKKTILAIDSSFQKFDSFISTGPAHLINEKSAFRPTLFIDYDGDYSEVINRITKRKPETNNKIIDVKAYKELDYIEKLGMVQLIVSILRIATKDDILFIFRSTFNAHVSINEIYGLIAILRGSDYLISKGPYGHFFANAKKPKFLEIRSGSAHTETTIKFKIAELIESNIDFYDVLEEVMK